MIAVLTTEMVRFEIDAGTWKTTRYVAEDGRTQLVTVLLKGSEEIAEFADVHAVWRTDKGSLIKPEDDN